MEDVLDVYHAPYDPLFPLVCMDESNKQLVGEVHAPLAAAPGAAKSSTTSMCATAWRKSSWKWNR